MMGSISKRSGVPVAAISAKCSYWQGVTISLRFGSVLNARPRAS
jgi:hypothetical protein